MNLKLYIIKQVFYSPKELDNYFPRVLNWENINADRAGLQKKYLLIYLKKNINLLQIKL